MIKLYQAKCAYMPDVRQYSVLSVPGSQPLLRPQSSSRLCVKHWRISSEGEPIIQLEEKRVREAFSTAWVARPKVILCLRPRMNKYSTPLQIYFGRVRNENLK